MEKYIEKLDALIRETRLNKSSDLQIYTYLKSVLMANSKEKKPLDDEEALRRYRKTVTKSMLHYTDQEPFLKELRLIDALLPKLMSEDNIRLTIRGMFSSEEMPELALGPTIGYVQKYFKKFPDNKADPSLVAKIVKEEFN